MPEFACQPDVFGTHAIGRHMVSMQPKLGCECVLRIGRRYCAYFLRGQQAPRRATFTRIRPVDAGTAPVVNERMECSHSALCKAMHASHLATCSTARSRFRQLSAATL